MTYIVKEIKMQNIRAC